MRSRVLLAVAVAATAIALLSGCAAGEGSTTDSSPGPTDNSPQPEPSETPTEEPFTMPTECSGILPTVRIASFEAQGLVLLGGPGGLYGENYLLDPTPEEAAGGITCIWGDELVPESTVTVSVAPLSPETRSGIIEELISQGLNETELEHAISYSRLGDEVSSPAIVNVLRTNSWISVIEALGGEAFLEEAITISDEVAAQVHAD
jgi:hypothetical protein